MNAQSDPFAGMPNADDSENGEFSPAKITPSMPRGLDIIERTGEAEYYLREARRAGLPLPAYVTVSSHHHGSHIGMQLASTEDVRLWALHFGTQPVIGHGGISAELGYAANHKVDAYYVFPKPDRKPVPPQPPMTDTMSGSYVPGLAEHTAAAQEKIIEASRVSARKLRLYSGDGIKISIEQIRPGVRFDTQYESGCVVADDPAIHTYPNDKGFSFDALDSDGVLYSFGSSMISRIDTATADTITKAAQ